MAKINVSVSFDGDVQELASLIASLNPPPTPLFDDEDEPDFFDDDDADDGDPDANELFQQVMEERKQNNKK